MFIICFYFSFLLVIYCSFIRSQTEVVICKSKKSSKIMSDNVDTNNSVNNEPLAVDKLTILFTFEIVVYSHLFSYRHRTMQNTPAF